MGKQVRFFMLPGDELLFLEYVVRDANVRILMPYFNTSTPKSIDSESVLQSRESTYYLWNTNYPIESLCIQKVQWEKTNNEKAGYPRDTLYVTGSSTQIPVIEYWRSVIRENDLLSCGRIWAEMYSTDGSEFIYKGEIFENWYNQLAQWLRSNLKRAKGVHGYIGREALKWQREGGQLKY